MNQERSLLLRLPAELRNKIYTRVCDTASADRNISSCPLNQTAFVFQYSGAVLRFICRQISSEATRYIERPGILQVDIEIGPRELSALLSWYPLVHSEAVHTLQVNTDFIMRMCFGVANAERDGSGEDKFYTNAVLSKQIPRLRRLIITSWVEGLPSWNVERQRMALNVLVYLFQKELEVVFP